MTHDELMDILYRANGEEEVIKAREIRDRWLLDHPNTPAMELEQIYQLSESLEMLAEGYTLQAAGKLPPEPDEED